MLNKFKQFWLSLTTRLGGFGKWLLGAILIIALTVVAIITLNNASKDDSNNDKPQIAQVYEPSIGTPLPADTTPSNTADNLQGSVSGASTTEPSNSSTDTSKPAPQTPQIFTAPISGIDDNLPIKYFNDELKLKAVLPAQTKIVEANGSVTFYSRAGLFLYSITTVNSSDALDTILSQLKNSPDAKNITQTTFANNLALQFNNHNNTGYVISKNNRVYYIIGNPKYLVNINI